MINRQQLKERVIIPALIAIDMYSADATRLLLMTAATESGLGSYLLQLPNGPALGIYQMEPATYNDGWDIVLEFNKHKKYITLAAAEYEEKPSADRLIWDLRYATIMARMMYSRFPEKIPAHTDNQAMIDYYFQYWGPNPDKTTKEDALDRALLYLGEK